MTDELNGRHHQICLGWCQKLRLHDKGGKSGLQCLRIHLGYLRFGCPQFLHHERQHLGGIRQSTGPSFHAGRGHALLFPKGFGTKADQSHSMRKAYGLVLDKRVINTNTKSSYPYGYERIREEVDLLLDL